MSRPVTRAGYQRSAQKVAELSSFAGRLVHAMARQGMSQSDLARAMWGEMTDPRGRLVARHRDRISQYVRALQMPEPKTIQALASALGVPPEDLHPDVNAVPTRDQKSPCNITMIGGRPDLSVITLEALLTTEEVMKIVQIVGQSKAAATYEAERTAAKP